MNLPPIMDAEYAAKLLRCSAKTVEERARKGELPGLKFGDGWIFPAEAMMTHLNSMALQCAEGLRTAHINRHLMAMEKKIQEPAIKPGRPRATYLDLSKSFPG